MNIDYLVNLNINNFSKLSENNPNYFDNQLIFNDKIDNNNGQVNYNLINNRPIAKKHSSTILKSPKKELSDSPEKKILGDINSLIKIRFRTPNREDDCAQPFPLNLMIPANVNFFH